MNVRHRFLAGVHISKDPDGIEGNVQIALGTTLVRKNTSELRTKGTRENKNKNNKPEVPSKLSRKLVKISLKITLKKFVNKMETNTKQEEASSEPVRITSEIKVKNPLRVAQGKKLAAISKEAKARKAREREENIRKEEVDRCEKENYFPYATTTLFPVIGILVFGGSYYFFQQRKKEEDNNEKPSENSNLENF